MSQFSQSMRPVASFNIQNSAQTAKKVCLFPGHFRTDKVYVNTTTGIGFVVNNDESGIVAANHHCDIMLADVCSDTKANKDVVSRPNSPRCRYADLLNYVQLSGKRVQKIRITNLAGSSHRDIFDQEIEVSASAVGSKPGSQFLQLSSYKNPTAFDLDSITVDLTTNNLQLDATTLAFLTVPAGANFNIEYTFEE